MSVSSRRSWPFAAAVAAAMAVFLAGCSSSPPPQKKRAIKTGSVTVATVSLMGKLDMDRNAPILLRIFKEEAVLEVWKQERNGRYAVLRKYPICKFSGKLGPKIRTGDKQAPEGFYEIATKELNPYSRNHLAFNTGFPNAFDRQLGRTGDHLMVHGGCNSIGCYAMTHKRIEEIYGLLREALKGGQQSVPFQAFPFRMTEENLARHAGNPNMPFWRNLKEGHDRFLITGQPARVAACNGRYGFSNSRAGGDICRAPNDMAAYFAPQQGYSAPSPVDVSPPPPMPYDVSAANNGGAGAADYAVGGPSDEGYVAAR